MPSRMAGRSLPDPVQNSVNADPTRQRQTDRPLVILDDGLGSYYFDIELQSRKADVIASRSMMEFTPVAVVSGSKTIRIDDFGCVDVIENGQAYPASAVLQGKTSLQVTTF